MSDKTIFLKESARLYNLGFAVHWIKPRSKAPVKAGWSGPTRDKWRIVAAEYREGYGLGVRLGESSKLETGYLANIDIDLKSKDPKLRAQAFAVVDERFPGIRAVAPTVKTPHGMRLFVQTAQPVASGKVKTSSDECKVRLPTSEINRRQLMAVDEGKLTKVELDKGWRIRPAWEVEFMSIGKQVGLPPSIHPETLVPYQWHRPLIDAAGIPLVSEVSSLIMRSRGRPTGTIVQNFKPTLTVAELSLSDLSDRIIGMFQGDGVTDRSNALMSVAIAMLKHGYVDSDIMSVLTERDCYLGETAYDHRKTDSRGYAAAWIRDYTIPNAKAKVSATDAFDAEVSVSPVIDDADEVATQTLELTKKAGWEARLECSGKYGEGPPKTTLKNTVLVLENAGALDVFKRDLFSRRDFYGIDAPWGGVKGEALTDDDSVKVKHWLAHEYQFEPSVNTVMEAMAFIAARNSFHPIRDELEALPPWDGVGRIDTWLAKYFKAKGPDEYLAQLFRKWLVASVTRTYVPGFKFDWMPIFEGMQGTGKSSFGAILFGEKYFLDGLPPLTDKDAALALQGIRCVEFGELDSLRRNEMEVTKAFVTRQTDKVRPPYGIRWLESHRQCIFFGTTNKSEYLKDNSGNRRFNPVKIGKLNFGALVRDRDQLWAEALFIYRNGLCGPLYLEGEAHETAKEFQEDKMVVDDSRIMAERLREFFEREKLKPENERFNAEKFKLLNLFDAMGPLNKFPENPHQMHAAAGALKLIGALNWKSDGRKYWKIDTGTQV